MGRRRAGAAGHGGFSLIELLVALAIIVVLAGLLLPAVQSARETGRSLTCRNRLRSLAAAVMHFYSSRESFPPARLVPHAGGSAAGVPTSTWLIRVLPFLDQPPSGWDDTKPYDQQADEVRGRVVVEFICPTRRDARNAVTPSTRTPDTWAACGCLIPGRFVSGGAVSDFAGNHGHEPPGGSPAAGSGLIVTAEAFPGTARWRPWVRHADVLDGLSNTLLAGELHVPRSGLCRPPDNGPAYDGAEFFTMSRVGGRGVPLGDGPDDDVAGMGMFAFGSWHAGGCHFAYGDGRVEVLSPAIAADVLAALCNRSDGTR